MSSDNNEHNVTSSQEDIENSNSDDDKSMLKFYLKPENDSSKTDSPKSRRVVNNSQDKIESKADNSQKNLEQLTYQDLKKSDIDDSKYLVSHTVRYNLPIYQHPNFGDFDLNDQVQLLCSYHSEISIRVEKQARMQLECVPYPLIIKASPKLSNLGLLSDCDNLREDYKSIHPFDALLGQESEPYISRSGRMTKRKFYSEPPDLDSKKPKVKEDEWSAHVNSNRADKSKKVSDDFDFDEVGGTGISKTNMKIMARSPLFKDKDIPKTGRMAKIAEGVELKKQKDEEEAEKLEKFDRSLSSSADFINDSGIDETEVRRRIVPPLPKARTVKSRKQNNQNEVMELPIELMKPGVPGKSQTCKSNTGNTSGQKKSNNSSGNQSSSSGIRKQNKNMVSCPICSRDFKSVEIEDHASTCGENNVVTRSYVSGATTTTCISCDQTFLTNDEYQTHVKNCGSRSLFH